SRASRSGRAGPPPPRNVIASGYDSIHLTRPSTPRPRLVCSSGRMTKDAHSTGERPERQLDLGRRPSPALLGLLRWRSRTTRSNGAGAFGRRERVPVSTGTHLIARLHPNGSVLT